MASVQDVARFFIDLAQQRADHGQGDLMTNLRLQKLLYFAQGWHLARYGKPLFPDEIEAWKYGPVVPAVYNKYMDNGSNGICDESASDADSFSSNEYALLLDVAREYERHATSVMVDMTHGIGTPWAQTEQRHIIPQEKMRTFFASERPLSSFEDALSSKMEIITPKRDGNGVAIIPADIADGWEWDDED